MPVDWFNRGRDAFTEVRPCFCNDARISGASRQAWYNGWRHQQALNTSPALREELDQAIAGIGEILDLIKSQP